MNSKLLLLIICTVLLFGCSPEISESLTEEILTSETDFTVITPQKALFIFKIDPQESWEWNTESEPANQIEYAWWTDFSLDGKKYSSGFYLYKHPVSKKSSGSLKQLLRAGQTNFSTREHIYEKKLPDETIVVKESNQQKKNPEVKSIAKANSVIIILEEQDVIEQFREFRPDSILFYRLGQPSKNLIQNKVAVSYTSR